MGQFRHPHLTNEHTIEFDLKRMAAQMGEKTHLSFGQKSYLALNSDLCSKVAGICPFGALYTWVLASPAIGCI